MKEGCLICGAPLEYLERDEAMECAICRKTFPSKARCVNGHYICDTCHTAGMDQILALCLRETSTDPVEILEKMMSMEFCHMHGPEHHVMVGAALLTACKNAGGEVDLAKKLPELYRRGSSVPGGACGFWGACGAGVSTGIFVSVLTDATPLSEESWGLSNQMTSQALAAIGATGGPRCCKRDSYLAIGEAIDFTEEHFGIRMTKRHAVCSRSHRNGQCLRKRCPFHPANHITE